MKFSIMFSFVSPSGDVAAHRDSMRQVRELLPLAQSLGYDSFA